MSFVEQVEIAKKNIRNIFPETPLQKSKYLSDKYDANIYLKREDLTPVRSYKIRGAYNFITSYLEKVPLVKGGFRGIEKNMIFVCASAGNHAQGFAFACSRFKAYGKVFMPITTPQQKIQMTQTFGGEYIEIILTGDSFDEASKAAKVFCDKESGVMVPPFDHPKIIEGQATIGEEILSQIETKIDILVVPVGGGGLSAGLTELFKTQSPKTEIFATEPLGAPSLKASLEKGERVTLENINTFVDGAAVKLIGENNFEILKHNLKNEVLLVPENRLCQTMINFLHHEGIILEPAGGLAIDALKNFPAQDLKGKTIVCVVSGGNFDFERLPDVKERAMKYAELKKYFVLRMPQRPGALKEFLGCLGNEDDIARFEYLKKSAKNFGSVLIGIETKKAKNFISLFQKMDQIGFEYKDVTEDEILADFII